MAGIQSRSTVFLIATLIVVMLLPGILRAQSTSARLSGTVWDPSDNPTPGVILTAVEETTGWQSEVVSDENGRYVFLSLRPGYYTVSTKAKGYQQITRRRIYLPINGNITESFTLDVAAADETVAMEENVATDVSDAFSNLSRRDLETLPMYSRNPLTLVSQVPGVQANGGNQESSTSNGARKGMNSLRVDGIEMTDPVNPELGLSVIPLNPDSIQMMHVVTSGAKAEFGGTAGAQVGVVSLMGEKSWHGSAFDYFSNKSLNANDYFRRISGLGRPNFRRNMFGGTLSGPLGNNRTLLFADYEGRRTGSEIRRNRLVLTDDADDDTVAEDTGIEQAINDEARAGVFSWHTPGSDDLHKYYIVNSPSEINPVTAQALALMPSPNNTLIGDGLNTAGYAFDNPIHNNSDQAAVRIDHTISRNHSIFLNFNWSKSDATDIWDNADAPFPNTPEGTLDNTAWSIVAGSHFTLNPSMINEFRIGYVRPKTEFNRPARSSQPMVHFNSWTDPLNPDYPRSYMNPYLELTDGFTHQYNRHILKYGATFRRNRLKTTDYSGVYPDITLGTTMGNAPSVGPVGNTVITDADRQTFENLYNDILGRIESISQTYYSNLTDFQQSGTPRQRDFVSYELSGFLQDDWRVLPNLTLNLGLRYDYFSVPNEQNDLQLVLDPNSSIGTTGSYSDFNLVSSSEWRKRQISNFAPRAGFSWDISRYGTLVLRGSYGMYYDRLPGSITNFIDQNTYGLSQTVDTYPNLEGGDVRLGDAGIPYPVMPQETPNLMPSATRSASIAVLDPNLKTPRVDRFNLTLQRRMNDHFTVEISYLGSRGRNLYQNLNYNQLKTQQDFLPAFLELQAFRENGTPVSSDNTLVRIFGSANAAWEAIGADASGVSYVDSGQAGAAANVVDKNYFSQYAAAGVPGTYLRNFPQFDTLIVGTDTGRSWYDSLQFGARVNSAPFRMRAFYTWGKSLDTLSADGNDFISPSDSFNPLLNKAPSDFDRTHIINFSGSFDVPIGRNRHWGSESSRVFNSILGDWEVGFLSLWESGQRFSVYSGLQTVFAGVDSLANYDGSRSYGAMDYRTDGAYWFNTAEVALFSNPAAGEMGTSGRNSFKGPKYFNVDMTFSKPFNVGNDKQLQVRAGIYNLFNQTHYGIPVNNLSQSGFGSFTSTIGMPRAVQVALRYSF